MADTRSVHFSPIIEQASDETSIVSSDVGLFLEGMNFEDAYTASLSKGAKKYRLSSDQDDEARAPRTRKIALLSISFIILLAIGVGVAIYLITRGLYNKEGHFHIGSLGDTRIPMENTSRLVIVSTTNYSSGRFFSYLFPYCTCNLYMKRISYLFFLLSLLSAIAHSFHFT